MKTKPFTLYMTLAQENKQFDLSTYHKGRALSVYAMNTKYIKNEVF